MLKKILWVLALLRLSYRLAVVFGKEEMIAFSKALDQLLEIGEHV
jgi:hypothetical protein